VDSALIERLRADLTAARFTVDGLLLVPAGG